MQKKSKTEFLNLDLDVYSKSDLTPLIHALGKRVFVLYLGRESRLFRVHLELSSCPKSAEKAVRELVSLIRGLPPKVHRLWNACASRTFNIGIQSGEAPGPFEMSIGTEAIRQVASVRGEALITVYGSSMAKARRSAR